MNVYVFDGSTYTGFHGVTAANGQVSFTLPLGSYRFRADLDGTQFWSGESNHCTLPGCRTAGISVTQPVTVNVRDWDDQPYAGMRVYAFDGATYTGYNATTDLDGAAIFTLPQGNYHFRTDYEGVQLWSSTENGCWVPAWCSSTRIYIPVFVSLDMMEETIDYTYDPLYRLTDVHYSTTDLYHYTYDAVGNRLTQTSMVSGLSSTVAYVYDDANRLTSVNGVPYTWDANGNLLNDGVNTYSYDAANRLTSFNDTATYIYNGLGDRLQQTVDGETTQYTLDLNAGLAQVLDDGTYSYTYGVGRISQQRASLVEYFLGDALGSTRQLTNAEGAVILFKSYAPYGELMEDWGEGSSPFGFTGEQTDPNGLVYLRARYYDPASGRFTTRDSWQGDYNRPLSLNRWMYVEGNPVNFADPSGLLRCPWNPAYECTGDQVLAYYADPLLKLLGVKQKSYNINIPSVGNINTTGTPTRMFVERTGPGLNMVGDTGLSFMPGYNEINAAFGYNQITGYSYTSEERLWMSLWGVLGLGDCFPGLRFAPDGVGGGALPGAKRFLINGKWEAAPAKIPVKFGYTDKLRRYINKIPGASYLSEESWGLKGLVSSETFEKGSWQAQALEAMSNSSKINFIVDGMDILRFPVEDIKPAYGKSIFIATHWEMDQILTRGYLDKLHLWDGGVEITGIRRLEWIQRWKLIRDIQ